VDNLKLYLMPTYTIDSTHPAITKLAAKLTGDLQEPREKAITLFKYVRDNIDYSMYEFSEDEESLRASNVLLKGKGWCVQKAILLTALGRAAGIPSRLVVASIINYRAPKEVWEYMGTNIFFPHAYNQFYLDDRWIKTAATFNRDLCERIQVPVVEFDGYNDAALPEKDLNGNPYIEYVDEYGYYHDFLMKMFLPKIREMYGQGFDKL